MIIPRLNLSVELHIGLYRGDLLLDAKAEGEGVVIEGEG